MSEAKLLRDIEQHGWHVIKIIGDEEGPAFCYSIGFFQTFHHPEIIIVGLNHELAHALINNIGEDIRAGRNYQSGKSYSGIIDGYDCFMLEVAKVNYSGYFGYGEWYYKNDDFPVLQCIYPTIEGTFPWSNSSPKEFQKLQPILGDLKGLGK